MVCDLLSKRFYLAMLSTREPLLTAIPIYQRCRRMSRLDEKTSENSNRVPCIRKT